MFVFLHGLLLAANFKPPLILMRTGNANSSVPLPLPPIFDGLAPTAWFRRQGFASLAPSGLSLSAVFSLFQPVSSISALFLDAIIIKTIMMIKKVYRAEICVFMARLCGATSGS